jgi:ketosteroid isomerase-like protein
MEEVKEHLRRFDELDFEAFSKQNWTLFNEIHMSDVEVIFPDGHRTRGIERHDDDMKAMFAYAPDLKIKDHPVSFGSGEWTATIGTMAGTFTGPMQMPDGRAVPPTGKSFQIPMATIAHWTDGRITQEYLFWDSLELMRQMGVTTS